VRIAWRMRVGVVIALDRRHDRVGTPRKGARSHPPRKCECAGGGRGAGRRAARPALTPVVGRRRWRKFGLLELAAQLGRRDVSLGTTGLISTTRADAVARGADLPRYGRRRRFHASWRRSRSEHHLPFRPRERRNPAEPLRARLGLNREDPASRYRPSRRRRANR